MKTATEIESDVMRLISGSSLAQLVNGAVCRDGQRGQESQMEDIVVKFVTGSPDQIESGTVNINVYVPDVQKVGFRSLIMNESRIKEIEAGVAAWVATLQASVSDYKFRAISTVSWFRDPGIRQHYVNVRLKFEYF